MLSKAEIKRISALKEKKFRLQTGLFLVEGEKMVSEALASPLFEVESHYRIEDIGEDAMRKISALSSPSPALAVCRQKQWSFKLDSGLYLALDGIRDPGNLGTILRIADWFAIDGVLLSSDCCELYSPKTVQSSMGAIFRVPAKSCDLATELSTYKGTIAGTFLHGDNLYEAPTLKDAVLVIGSESFGVSTQIEEICNLRLTIPALKKEGSESLNAAVATAVCVAEIQRRRIT